jgi:PAS domain S-box-containing protein
MKYKLQDLIDIDHFQNLQDRLNKIYSFPSAIIDNEGNILTATAWQDICVQFHRKNKETEKLCLESDQYIQDHIHEANPAVSYRCPHGLVDNATPIVINGIHYGNFFTGQFFLEKPDLEFFRAQVHKYGFEENSYLDAVRKVPVWTQEQLDNYLFFIKGLIAVISESGLKTLKEIENRKLMEATEKRHKSILKTAMDGYWLIDSTGRLLEVNDTYCHMSGYSEDDLLTRHISDLDAVENLKVVTQRIEKIISQGSDRFETKHRRKDGTVFDVEISVQYRPEEDGLFVCFIRDMTERKSSELRYSRMQDILMESQRIAHIGSFELIVATQETEWSDEEFRIYGLNPSEGAPAYQDILQNSIHSDEAELVDKAFKEAVENCKILELTHKIVRPDGTVRIVHDVAHPYFDDAGNLYRYIGVTHDITEKKHAEENLKKQNYYLEKAQQIGNIGTWELDLDRNKLYWTDENCRIFGVPEGSLVDYEKFLSKIHPDDHGYVDREWRAALSGKPYDIEHRLLIGDELKWVREKADVIFDDNGKVTKAIGVTQDITDRKQSEELQHIQHDLSYQLVDVKSLEQGLEICLDASLNASNMEAGGIYLMNEETGGADLVHHKGLHEKFVNEVRHFEADSENVAFLKKKKPIYTEYQKLDISKKEFEKSVDYEVICIIPLTFQDNLIGCINLTSAKQKTIPGFSRVAVETIANQIGSWVNYNRTKQTLHESERRFSLAMEAAQDGMYDWNLIENTIYYSPGWKRMLGYKDSELPNDFSIWEKLTNPQDVQRSWKMQNELITKKRARFELEFKMKHKDGHWVDILSRATAIFDNNGTAIRVVGTHVDITERKQAEKRLSDVLQFNEKIISKSPVGLTIYEADSGRCIEANAAITKLIGGTKEEILRQNFYKIESWKKSGLLTTAKEVIEKKISKRKTIDVSSSFGKNIAIDCHFSQFSFSEKQHLLLTTTDVTQKLKNEKTIIRQRETAERYLNLAGVMFIGLDKDGNINVANKKACQILEVQQEEVLGQNWFDIFISKDIRHDVYTVFQQIIGGDVELSEYHENSVVSKTGKEKHIAWHNTTIKNEEGDITGLLSSGEDITEKKQLRLKLQQAQKMESIGTLAGGIAHDFNNILSSVIGFTELALDAADKETPIAEDLHEVYSAGLRAKDLVQQILTFARQSDEKLAPIQADIIIKEVLKFIRSSIPTTIEIKQTIKSDSLIMGNPTQIHRIMMNLCTNAAHAMENEGGTLEVALKDINIERAVRRGTSHLQSGNYIEIKVSDTGDGIEPQIINKIFEPYFTTKKRGEGTGMGLAMVHGIVETYGGIICAESSMGKGTVFTVYLPVARVNKAHQQYKVEELPTGQERILFIDDEAQIAKFGSRILGQLGYSVTSITNSLEALELFQTKPNDFDLVISDVTMPEMTGDILAQKLMQIRQDIPIILSTGYSKKVSAENASKIGVKALIVKPFVKTDLAQTVRKVLDTD